MNLSVSTLIPKVKFAPGRLTTSNPPKWTSCPIPWGWRALAGTNTSRLARSGRLPTCSWTPWYSWWSCLCSLLPSSLKWWVIQTPRGKWSRCSSQWTSTTRYCLNIYAHIKYLLASQFRPFLGSRYERNAGQFLWRWRSRETEKETSQTPSAVMTSKGLILCKGIHLLHS